MLKMSYANNMDHFEVLREKVGRLRAEIAQIQEQNQQYRRQGRNDTEAQIAHGQRQERLQAIQQELSQLAGLGRKVLSIEEMKEKHRSRMHLVKKVS
jgi:conjugal transfer/entry exclusion protein